MRIPRLPLDQYFMLHAHLVATRSTCNRGPELLFDPGRHGVGAVIVKDKRIIASGYNGSPPGHPHCDWLTCPECEWENDQVEDPIEDKVCPKCSTELRGGHVMVEGHCVATIHSEENAIIQCALDETNPDGGGLYTTASPCYDCTKRILRAGIRKVCYGADYDSRYGLSSTVRRLFQLSNVELVQVVVTRDSLS